MKSMYKRWQMWHVTILWMVFLVLVNGCERQPASNVQCHPSDVDMDYYNSVVNDMDLHVEIGYGRYRGVTNSFIRLTFERDDKNAWCCRELNAELLSLPFLVKLQKGIQTIRDTAMHQSIGIRLYFPEDFPFPLRQALIATMSLGYFDFLEAIVTDKQGSLSSAIAATDTIVWPPLNETLRDRVVRIREEHDSLIREGGCVISIVDESSPDFSILKTFRITNMPEYCSAAREMLTLKKSSTISWTWGEVGDRYYEDVIEVKLCEDTFRNVPETH